MRRTPELAALLKRIRVRADIGQDRLSLQAGLSETYYGKIENGRRRPTGAVLNAILDALPCTAEERRDAVRLLVGSYIPQDLLGEWIITRPRRGAKRLSWAIAVGSGLLLGLPPAPGSASPITRSLSFASGAADTRDSVALGRRSRLARAA